MARPEDADFTEFVQARSGALLRYAYLLTGNQAAAEDLLQQTLVKIYLSWNRIAERGATEAYARTTMTRTHVSWWRRASSKELVSDQLPDRPASGGYDHGIDERDAMWSLLATLGARQRAVLVLRFYEDMPEAQIAEVLGCSVGTVKSQLSRGLANLRGRLTEPTHAAAEGGAS